MSRSQSTRRGSLVRPSLTLGLGLMAVALSACGSGSGNTQRKEGFVHPSLPYMVREAGGGSQVLPGWRVDNLESGDEGEAGDVKQGPEYNFALSMDNDGDNVREYFVDLPRYDLRLKNDAVGAEVFVRTQPLAPAMRAANTESIFNTWLDFVGHTGELAPDLAADPIKGEAPKYATKVISKKSRTIDGQPGFEAVVEVADVPPSGVQPHTQWRRVTAVVVKTNFDWPANKSVPALFMAVHAANTTQAAQSAAQFETFVENIEFLTDAQMVGLHNADILSECQPDPKSFKLKLSVTKDGRRTAYSTDPTLGEDPKACLEYYLDKMQLPARGESHTFETRLGPSVNALAPRPKNPDVGVGRKPAADEVGTGSNPAGESTGAKVVGEGAKGENAGAGAKDVGTGGKDENAGAGAKDVGTGGKGENTGTGAKVVGEGSKEENTGAGAKVVGEGAKGENAGKGAKDVGTGGKAAPAGAGAKDVGTGSK